MLLYIWKVATPSKPPNFCQNRKAVGSGKSSCKNCVRYPFYVSLYAQSRHSPYRDKMPISNVAVALNVSGGRVC